MLDLRSSGFVLAAAAALLLCAPACSGDGASSSDGGGGATTGSGAGATTGSGSGGAGPTIAGCPVFSADDAWNTDISGEPADETWTQRIQAIAGDINLHPDFGNYGATEQYGLPINVVPESQPPVDVAFDLYPEESDPSPYPFPEPGVAAIEGGDATACDGDCHLLVVQEGACVLYEGAGCTYTDGWHCGCGARWDLTSNSYGQRPKGWTSADAAGLAITPGLVRHDEVMAGEVRHAIRFTMSCTRPNYVAPATHQAVPSDCSPDDPDAPPMGLRVRLRADFDVSGFAPPAQAVLTAMKRYGMILADNGSDFYFQGERHPGWIDTDVDPLKGVPVSAFEVIQPPPLEP